MLPCWSCARLPIQWWLASGSYVPCWKTVGVPFGLRTSYQRIPTELPAVTLWATVNSSGTKYLGTATGATRTGPGEYTVAFAQSVERCAYLATLATVDGPVPPPGAIIVAPDGITGVRVKTYAAAGTPLDDAFNLLVVC